MPITYDRIAPENAQRTARMLAAAMKRLSDQGRQSDLTSQELTYLRTFRGFKVGPYRSGQSHAIYTRGVADYTPDLDWTASEIIHDSVHAYLWQHGTRFDDERLPSEVQAAYLRRIGRPELAARAHQFGMNLEAQHARRIEPY